MSTKERMPPTVWVLLAAAFVIAMGFGLIAPVLPQLAHDMAAAVFPDAAVTATSVVISSFAVLRLAWATPAGLLVGRFGEKRTYIAGVFIVAISTALTAFAGDYWQLLLFRSMGGIGSVMFTVAAMGLLIRIAPRHMRGRVTAMYGAMFMIGNMVGPVFGGTLAEFGIAVPFLIYASALLVAGVIMWARMPSTSPGHTVAGQAESTPMTLAEALRDRAFVANLPGLFGHGWANFGVRIALVPLFVSATVSRSAWVSGAALALFAVGTAIALPFASHYADRVGRKPMILWGLAMCGGFTASFGLFSGHLTVFLACLLAGFGTGMFNPASQAVIADVVGSDRSAGKVVATTQMVTDVGSILGPLVAGAIADAAGYGVAFAVTGGIVFLGAVAWLGTPDTIGRTRDQR
ncbi:MFS transporter [uncultured Tessaracoccus sp.]|uniref:MFS transporter n=1 Tax=uncultured Tessaracoccus sp. TaxID=905023 RepID=UPI0025E8090A|nr:MFS transporter [uncultured Tessaracoccus sp.]